MFQELEKKLKKLGASEVLVSAAGQYPNKRKTKVQDVAKYQNDGTEKIKASKFVQRAEAKAGNWSKEVGEAIEAFLFGSDPAPLLRLGVKVADDITRMIDRIDTRRLKGSMKATVK